MAFRSKKEVEENRAAYRPGAKLRITEIDGEPQMPSGTGGVVDCVDDIGQIHMRWVNGS